ncbi:hypothetical protein OPV22_011294 [Ensete ventricosum]|uniref:Uncharacterized protein n=1 Tax=Ensete ventricosum TaxID=4639 RepID=A0AAV8RIR2_ENSVE|nr:hypothetical protein OPV22_011294 [Ensete ventricosum]
MAMATATARRTIRRWSTCPSTNAMLSARIIYLSNTTSSSSSSTAGGIAKWRHTQRNHRGAEKTGCCRGECVRCGRPAPPALGCAGFGTPRWGSPHHVAAPPWQTPVKGLSLDGGGWHEKAALCYGADEMIKEGSLGQLPEKRHISTVLGTREGSDLGFVDFRINCSKGGSDAPFSHKGKGQQQPKIQK